jgi:hypothetical protein
MKTAPRITEYELDALFLQAADGYLGVRVSPVSAAEAAGSIRSCKS